MHTQLFLFVFRVRSPSTHSSDILSSNLIEFSTPKPNFQNEPSRILTTDAQVSAQYLTDLQVFTLGRQTNVSAVKQMNLLIVDNRQTSDQHHMH